jgi:hypothetical protein
MQKWTPSTFSIRNQKRRYLTERLQRLRDLQLKLMGLKCLNILKLKAKEGTKKSLIKSIHGK